MSYDNSEGLRYGEGEGTSEGEGDFPHFDGDNWHDYMHMLVSGFKQTKTADKVGWKWREFDFGQKGRAKSQNSRRRKQDGELIRVRNRMFSPIKDKVPEGAVEIHASDVPALTITPTP